MTCKLLVVAAALLFAADRVRSRDYVVSNAGQRRIVKGAGSVEFQHCDEALQVDKRLINTVNLPLLVQHHCKMAQHHIRLRVFFTLNP